MDCTKTLRLRIKDKHAKSLAAMAREVNQVWNFCNETSHRAIRERRQFLSGYDLQKLTNGFSKCDGVRIGSPTVQQVCEDYAKVRKQFKKTKLRWRVSNPQSSKYSLGCGAVHDRDTNAAKNILARGLARLAEGTLNEDGDCAQAPRIPAIHDGE